MNQNWIDRVVASLNPLAGVRRAQARLALEQVRAYEASKFSRTTADWNAGGGSANAEIGPSLTRVRNRCRQMVRDNEYASRGLDALVAHTVGTGIEVKMPNPELFKRWSQYCDADGQLDFNGLVELAHRTRREAGEVLVRFRQRNPDDGFEVPLQLQVLEPDHLDDSKVGSLNNGNVVIYGVEFNAIGQRVAYWLFPIHPGEVAGFRRRSLESRRVPADQVLHYYRKRRPTQVRGISEYATALMRLRNLSDYELAELVRKKIEACFVAFVKSDDPNGQLGDTLGQAKGPPREEKMRPGMIKYLPNSDAVAFGQPSSIGGYGEFKSTELHAIAAGIGCTYEMLTGDHSQLSFSGGRLSMLSLRPLIEQEQWLALVPMLLNPIAARFQQTARLAGKQRQAPQAVTWTMPRMPLQDLLKEAMGIKELVRGGLLSLPEAIRELGYDPDEVFSENKIYRQKLLADGVLVDTDPAVALKLLKPESAAEIIESLIQDSD